VLYQVPIVFQIAWYIAILSTNQEKIQKILKYYPWSGVKHVIWNYKNASELTALFAKQNNSNLWDSIIRGFFGIHRYCLEPLCLAKHSPNTDAILPKLR